MVIRIAIVISHWKTMNELERRLSKISKNPYKIRDQMNRFKKDQNINNKPYSVKRNLPAIVHTVKALKTNIIVR